MRVVLALFALLMLALPTAPAAAQRDWTQTVVRTPEGGFRMGNPDAPIKLIEYLSLTCPHCADFAREAHRPLMQNYVRPGRVNVEYRNYYLNAFDIAAALVSRCAAPAAYFAMTHELLATQAQWMGRSERLTAAQRSEIGALAPLGIAQRLVPVLGLDAIGARHGVTPAIRARCLNDAALTQLDALRRLGERTHHVQGTPAFAINGRPVHAHGWAELEPLLRRAAGR